MKLTQEQQEILNGSRGETMAKVMETLVRYGELYDSDTMIPVTGKNNHLVTSFGLKALTPVYELMDQLIAEGAVSGTKFSAAFRITSLPTATLPVKKILSNFISRSRVFSALPPSATVTYSGGKTRATRSAITFET